MSTEKSYLCRDINGNVHIVNQSELVKRSSVYGIIKDPKGVLLVRDRTSDELWDLPGGGVDPGEGLMEALHREIQEETNLQVIGEPKKICEFTEYFFDVDSGKGWESNRYFYLIEAEGEPSNGNDDDITATRFFQEPLSANEVMPVAREIVALCS